jgi:hypothetical protein
MCVVARTSMVELRAEGHEGSSSAPQRPVPVSRQGLQVEGHARAVAGQA